MNCQRTIWKGSQDELVAPIYLTNITELTIKYFTDGEYEFEKTLEDVIIADNVVYVPIEEDDFDLLKDGVVRYSITYTDGTDTYRSDICTNYYLKTPLNYSAQTPTDYYDEGYDDGYEQGYHDASISGGSCVTTVETYNLTSAFTGDSGRIYPDEYYNAFEYFEVKDEGYGTKKYDDGHTDGVAEQKAKLSGITIYANTAITRADGWSSVTVNVPAIQYNKVIVSGTFVTSADSTYVWEPAPFGMYDLTSYPSWFRRVAKFHNAPVQDILDYISVYGSFTMSAGTYTFVADLTDYNTDAQPLDYPLQWVGFKNEISHNIKVFVIPQ